MPSPTLILIGGPTAAGKSALAMRLARQRSGTIINADAMQIYAGLPILTAQPTPADQAEIPHLLYETLDAADASSAGKWLALARAAIADTLAAGRTPIVVGGTGLYFNALRGRLADIPPIPATVRAEAERLYHAWGEAKFRAALAERDPASATRIARNDRQRLIRAYEVAAHTGHSLDYWQREHSGDAVATQSDGIPLPPRDGPGAGYIKLSAGYIKSESYLRLPDRPALYAACNARFLSMIERGALAEVKALLDRDLNPDLPAMKILGVRELAAHLRGQTTLDHAIAAAQQATRNYAKRQMTWFRNQWKDAAMPLSEVE